jgi:galactokinase
MEASHWSYGQRCALGSVESDLLAHLIRDSDAAVGVYGVKVVGQGCGGTIAVLMKSGDRAEAALAAAMTEYSKQTGRTPRLLRGSMPGCLVTGPRAI